MLEIDQRMWGNFAHHPDKRNETVAWSTVAGVARPPSAVFSSRRRERGGVQRRIRRGPRALCCRGGDYEAACEWLGSSVSHPVGWSVMLQRHRGVGSCMAVAFLVWFYLPPSTSTAAWSRFRFSTTTGVWVVGGCCGSVSVLLPSSRGVVVL